MAACRQTGGWYQVGSADPEKPSRKRLNSCGRLASCNLGRCLRTNLVAKSPAEDFTSDDSKHGPSGDARRQRALEKGFGKGLWLGKPVLQDRQEHHLACSYCKKPENQFDIACAGLQALGLCLSRAAFRPLFADHNITLSECPPAPRGEVLWSPPDHWCWLTRSLQVSAGITETRAAFAIGTCTFRQFLIVSPCIHKLRHCTSIVPTRPAAPWQRSRQEVGLAALAVTAQDGTSVPPRAFLNGTSLDVASATSLQKSPDCFSGCEFSPCEEWGPSSLCVVQHSPLGTPRAAVANSSWQEAMPRN